MMCSTRYLPAVFLVMLCASMMSAQQSKPGVSFKRLFMDYQTMNGGDFWAFKDYTDGLEFAYLHPLMGERLVLGVPVKIGMFSNDERVNTSVIGADLHLNYYLTDKSWRLSPYVLAGAGAVIENKDSVHLQIPLGFGLDLRVGPGAYITWQSEFRVALKDDRDNLHHGIGFKYFFGQGQSEELPLFPPALPDRDGDGIPDNVDLCPDVPGLAAFDGCPDTDGDGIPDHLDDCPDYPGLAEFNGCPDSDGDGIPDTEDECPHVPGVPENRGCPPVADRDGDGVPDDEDRCPDTPGTLNGCPDTDGDGIADIDDLCPTVFGLPQFQGCPDTDGDGIDDLNDRCPTMPGPASNGGCPVIDEKDQETLELAMRAVQFDHGSARLIGASHRILNQVADMMARYPDFKLEISGHTDNTGADAFNLKLSQDRAKACFDYIVSRGVNIRRMSYVGFGRTRPIADNNTQAGRQLNRRVEFNLIPGQ